LQATLAFPGTRYELGYEVRRRARIQRRAEQALEPVNVAPAFMQIAFDRAHRLSAAFE